MVPRLGAGAIIIIIRCGGVSCGGGAACCPGCGGRRWCPGGGAACCGGGGVVVPGCGVAGLTGDGQRSLAGAPAPAPAVPGCGGRRWCPGTPASCVHHDLLVVKAPIGRRTGKDDVRTQQANISYRENSPLTKRPAHDTFVLLVAHSKIHTG